MCLGLWVVSFLAEMPNFFGWGDHLYDRKTLSCVWDRWVLLLLLLLLLLFCGFEAEQLPIHVMVVKYHLGQIAIYTAEN